jgi:Zn-dependent protease
MLKQALRDRPLLTFRVRGVPVQINATSLLFLAWAGFVGLGGTGRQWQSAAFMTLFVVSLYLFGLLHELGHIMPARWFGAQITQVRVAGMGAFVRVESKVGLTPSEDLVVALGGPLVSAVTSVVMTALTLRALHGVTATQATAILLQKGGLSLLMLLAAANVLLTVFNLLPLFPMDGGRALSAALAIRMGPAQATRLVAVFGLVIAVVMVPLVLLLTNQPAYRLTAVLTAGLVGMVSMQCRKPLPVTH